MYSKEDMAFAAEFLNKVEKKIKIMAPQIGANFPSTNGRTGEWDPKGEKTRLSDWTIGFWPGVLWLMYIKTGDEMYKEFAEGCEEKMDGAFDHFTYLHHDVGFMWGLSAVADYKITGNERSRARGLHAASILLSRFNSSAKYIRAWPSPHVRRAIIDCMMNIPILFWASSVDDDDPRYTYAAMAHADTAMKHFVRPDGSVNHIIDFDPISGEPLEMPGGQGYGPGSSWSRGQSWAVYGFALAYLNTGKKEYLDTAKKVAHYFIANLEPGKLPLVDFRAPAEPVLYDASAAAITACGLIEIAKLVDEYEAPMYERAAMQLLRVLDQNCNYDEDVLHLLENNTGAYHMINARHVPYVFGDYYLVEALMKLYGNDGSFSVHK